METVSFCVKYDHPQPIDIIYLCQHYQQDETVLLDQYMCGRFVELQSSGRSLFTHKLHVTYQSVI